jgi:YD repeat-containing protein
LSGFVVETNPLNKGTSFTFANNRLTSITAEPSAHCAATYKETHYDINGYVSAVTDFKDNITSYSYAPNGQLLQKVEASGTPFARTTNIAWDPDKNRQTSITLVGDSRVSYTFNADNRVATRTVTNLSSNGVTNQALTTTYTYTKHPSGTLHTVTEDGPLPGSSDAVIYTYSAYGDQTEVRDGQGHVTAFANHNALGLPGRIVGPNGDITEYGYDGRGRVTLQRRYLNGIASDTTYRYGANGLLEAVSMPDGVVIESVYDAAQRLIEQFNRERDGRYARKQYTYNVMSRPTSITTIRSTFPWNTKIIGNIDGLNVDAVGDYTLRGWACSTGDNLPVSVHLYVGGAAGTGQFIGAYTANSVSEPAVAASCRADGAAYRFDIPVQMTLRSVHAGKGIYVHGISPAGAGNLLISSSGNYVIPGPPNAPTLSVPTSSADGSYTVSWGAIANLKKYQLQERASGGSWVTIVDSLVTTASINGKANGTYEYQVRACTATGCGTFSASKSINVLLPPAAAPTLTAPPSNSTGSYTVTWNGVATATTYELQERVNGGAWLTIASNSGATSKTVSGKPNGTYSYQARACNGSGCSAYSAIVSTTVTLPPPPTPTLTARYAVTQIPPIYTTFTMSWTSSSGATSYELQRIANGTATTIYQGSLAGYQYTNSGGGPLINGVMPKFQVRACNSGGCSAWSAQVTPSG